MDKVEAWLEKVHWQDVNDNEGDRQKLIALVRCYREANHDIGYGYLLTSHGAISDYQVRIKYEDMCRAAEEKAKEIVG